jgi:hypothetical protein
LKISHLWNSQISVNKHILVINCNRLWKKFLYHLIAFRKNKDKLKQKTLSKGISPASTKKMCLLAQHISEPNSQRRRRIFTPKE